MRRQLAKINGIRPHATSNPSNPHATMDVIDMSAVVNCRCGGC